MKSSFNDQGTHNSSEAAKTIEGKKPSPLAAGPEKEAADGEHMRNAVDIMVKHNQLMEAQPELHAKAKAHVAKHGAAKAMEMLPKSKITSIADLKAAAKAHSSSPEGQGGGSDYGGGGGY